MKKATTAFVSAALAGLVAAAPSNTIRQASNCEQYGSVQTGPYTVYNNLWNESAATSGSQCFSVTGLVNNVLSWATTWTWVGGAGQVKSYANAVVSLTATQIGSISSLSSSWTWDYQGSNLIADVAYDLFTSSSPTGDEEFELMVWLAAIGGAGPISSTYDAQGNPTPIGTATIAGTTWSVYKGPNGQMTVYSFVAPSQVTNFSGDLKDFYAWLVSNDGFSESQYLISAGAGTEAFEGTDAVFTTSAYSLVIS
ncbi:glycoside hydrolase family 12 protein [Zasmidium cellare ATCC 36951]|uniref:Glycoside hydrolase family 12 protein n=1 Tax=Zasmidium cellare ATCC 36951 TaxID=1080233 RepID=A0A6A6C1V6_ZASCE|nr:glycoside hydrolase family 12 protein [Zasmidium cellare ATCC 36951]KAF2161047.1 glycoside hydrolase family 12 protein [Zasmidium cellare ATCC 36951]